MRANVKTLMLLHNQVVNAIHSLGAPIFAGDGPTDYVCGACGAKLCTGMHDGELAGLAVVCGCGCANRVPWAPEPCAAQ